MRTPTFAAVAISAAILASGCGGEGGETGVETPEEAVQTYIDANAAQDSAAICEVISENSITAVIAGEGAESCEDAIEIGFAFEAAEDTAAQLEASEVGEAAIAGDTATVELTGPGGEAGTISLFQEDGGWKVVLG